MRIIDKGLMPDGTKIQLESWSTEFPNDEKMCWAVGAYPHRILNGKVGRPFRLTISFDSEIQAVRCMNGLRSGLKLLADYRDRFWYGDFDAERMGMK